jgi:hypothetical protein
MGKPSCEECAFRGKYDANQKSILGRIWRFHINFCPGWKKYMTMMPAEERDVIKQKYNIMTDRY